MKKIITILGLFFISCNILSQYKGDFTLFKQEALGICVEAEVMIYSILFEGKTDTTYMGQHGYRFDKLQNGSVFRRFNYGNFVADKPLYYYYEVSDSAVTGGTLQDLGHCYGNEINEDNIDGGWGFAKYAVKIKTNVGENYFFIFNCLDSKYGKPNWLDTTRYGHDWKIIYKGSLPFGRRVYLTTMRDETINDTISVNEQGKEIKVWEKMFNRQYPYATDFKSVSGPSCRCIINFDNTYK